MNDLTINGTSVFSEFGLIFKNVEISKPTPKLNIIDIPGTSEIIDLTEALSGDIEYERRKIKVTFESMCGELEFHTMHSNLCNFLSGVEAAIIFAYDPEYFWTGRLSIDSFAWQIYGGTLTLSAEVDPYKYQVTIPADYQGLTVDGTLSVDIIGLRKKICPPIVVSAPMTVTYLGTAYNLVAGENIIPDIFLGSGTHTLLFTGTGTVSVDYRGGSL